MKLKHIEYVSFHRSEWTNLQAVVRRAKLKLGSGEVACLVSMTGKQLCFVFNPAACNGASVLQSVRLRLPYGGTWNPTMLGNYAAQVGLDLEGIKRFEEYYAKHWTQERK